MLFKINGSNKIAKIGESFKILSTPPCSDNDAGVIMYGWEFGTRCLDAAGGGCGSSPVGLGAPYSTYSYGDEVVVYEDGVWKYKNVGNVLASSSDGPNYPWFATWPSPYSAEKWCEPQI